MTTEEKIAEVERLLRELQKELPADGTLTIKLPHAINRWNTFDDGWSGEYRTGVLEYWKSSTMDC